MTEEIYRILAGTLAADEDGRRLVATVGHDPADWPSGSACRLVGKAHPGAREHDATDDCMSMAMFDYDMIGRLPRYEAVRSLG